MAVRWTAVGMLEVERRFRRVLGYRDLPKLLAAIERELHPSEGRLSSRRPDRHRTAVDFPRRAGHPLQEPVRDRPRLAVSATGCLSHLVEVNLRLEDVLRLSGTARGSDHADPPLATGCKYQRATEIERHRENGRAEIV